MECRVYLLTNRWNTVLYTGVTNSLERRVREHKNKSIPGFTYRYNCDRLVHFERYDDMRQTAHVRIEADGTRTRLPADDDEDPGTSPLHRTPLAELRAIAARWAEWAKERR